MHLDIEKLAREAGLIEPSDVWEDLPTDYRVALSSLVDRTLQEVALTWMHQHGFDKHGCAKFVLTLSRQITEGK